MLRFGLLNLQDCFQWHPHLVTCFFNNYRKWPYLKQFGSQKVQREPISSFGSCWMAVSIRLKFCWKRRHHGVFFHQCAPYISGKENLSTTSFFECLFAKLLVDVVWCFLYSMGFFWLLEDKCASASLWHLVELKSIFSLD